jgi:hypothetical protein
MDLEEHLDITTLPNMHDMKFNVRESQLHTNQNLMVLQYVPCCAAI